MGKPEYEIKYYLLDYPAPVLKSFPQIDFTVRLDRFTIAAAYNTQNMIFRADNHSIDFFNYNRWAVNPADMVADMLLRDMQTSGLFRAVFSRFNSEDASFVLQGSVGEFFLRVEQDRKIAVICIEITLKDPRKRETNRRVIYQRKYCHEEVLTEQTPYGYCQAMSQAMKTISSKAIIDVYQSVK
ncbi:MAG TPA: ABC-type transport auxiliary lipoprotein family protein [Smithellaceae bacterium]|nr:ABC-type transport auxiliary lipoprotein family protein [Smithellaceae bacterium]